MNPWKAADMHEFKVIAQRKVCSSVIWQLTRSINWVPLSREYTIQGIDISVKVRWRQ